MKDETHPHKDKHTHEVKTHEVVEDFKEEGILTIESLDIKEDNVEPKDRKNHTHTTTKLTTPVAVILGSIIIAGGIIAYGFITRGGQPSVATTMFSGRVIGDTDYVEGNIKSDVIVVEYSDPECPFCVQVHPTIKQLRTEYSDKVAFVYRHFPLTQIHPHAFDESRAIACAGNIGGTKKFYEYIDALFGYKITNKTTQLPKNGKEDTARNIGLDTAAFSLFV